MTRILIKVKRKHIRNGICGDPGRCALAIAINDAVNGGKNVFHPEHHQASVGPFSFDIYKTNLPYSDRADSGKKKGNLPRSARRFIKNFDHQPKNKVKPFNFYLKID